MKTRYQSLLSKPVRVGAGCLLGVVLFVILLALLQASSDAGRLATAAPVIASDHADVEQPLARLPGMVSGNSATESIAGTLHPQVQGSNVELVGSYNVPGGAFDVEVVGGYAYVAAGPSGLGIINVSSPVTPTAAGFYTTDGGRGVAVAGDYAYLADIWSGLHIINVTNPVSPTLAGYHPTPGSAEDVTVVGEYAYVADGGGGLRIVNVADPLAPTETGAYIATLTYASGVAVSGSYAYVADVVLGLRVIDVSSPAAPFEAGYYILGGSAYDVYVSGNYAYVVGDGGLRVLDISNPAAPIEVGGYEWVSGLGVCVARNYAYVAGDDLWVVDVSNPTSPREVGFYGEGGSAYDVFVAEGYIYVADGVSGLLILRFTGGPGATYSISGRVTDANNNPNPISGVIVSAGPSGSTATDANGVYTVTHLIPAIYTLTPSMSGYSFTPLQRTVNVSQDVTGQDFIGVADGGPPARFLALPIEYYLYHSFALLNWHHPEGLINTWFDHEYPTYSLAPNNTTAGGLRLYTGRPLTTRQGDPVGPYPCYGNSVSQRYCYDGHDGIDFITKASYTPKGQNVEISAAEDGVVESIETGCKGKVRSCGHLMGNHVIIDHQNGYLTLYGHLDTVNIGVVVGTVVTTGRPLGTMGNTGNSEGAHLHFGVYRDDGDGGWHWIGNTPEDQPVDPNGWSGAGIDPWVAEGGPVSHLLWLFDLSQRETYTDSLGGTLLDPTGTIQADIPPGAISGQATLELSPRPLAEASVQLRSSGHSFRLRLLEWLPGGSGLQGTTALQSTAQFTLTQPITLTVTYTDTDVLHLHVAQLAFHHWNEDQEAWQPLSTTVDPDNRVATAQTQDLGEFDLQSPLLCPTDDLEPDDGYPAAHWIWPNDWPMARGLDIPQDSDWARFDAVQGARYTIRTQNLAGGANTVLNLYDVDALTLLAGNDDAGGGPASELVWTAPYTGTFFVEVVSTLGGTTGCPATYELTIATIPGDVIADCRVDVADLQTVADRWHLSAASPNPDGDPTTPNYETRLDLDRDGDVDVVDIMRVAAAWGSTCP